MRSGKLSPEELKLAIFDVIKRRRKEVVTTAALAEDCASFFADNKILVTSDPITAAKNGTGSLAIYISANDIYACGGEPFAVMLTVMMPCGAEACDVKAIMQEAESAAASENLEIIGGHTEFTSAVNTPVVSATMFGLASKSEYLAKNAEVGDSIVMSKSAGIEGTYILASESPDEEMQKQAEELEKSLSVRRESLAGKRAGVHVMHDVTEGGIFGAVAEVLQGASLGGEITESAIPVSPVTEKLTAKCGVSPYRLISSGSMLFFTPEPQKLIDELAKEGVIGTEIGKVLPKECGIYCVNANGKTEIEVEKDEISQARNNLSASAEREQK